MAKVKSKDLARAADQAIIDRAEYLTVIRFIGRSPGRIVGTLRRETLRERLEFHSDTLGGPAAALAAARAAKAAIGTDEHGRPAVIYAVGAGGVTVHVE